MTVEEIVKQEGRQPDCSGYVTKYDIECSDGLTIRPGAFDDDNGRRVPMVWMHDHKDMENVLGHIYLESRDDGVYGYGFFNDSPKGQLGKLYVDHGDISSFSIYANKLKKKARDVVHGMIREVSLVLAGANRGAIIDSPIGHSDQDEDEGEGVICMGDDYGGPIYGNDEPLSVEEYLEHYGRKGMKWGKNLFKTEYEAHPREKGEEEEESSGNGKQIHGPYESDGSIRGYSTLSNDDKQKVDHIAEKIKNSIDFSKYAMEPWMAGGPEDGAKALAVQILSGSQAFPQDKIDESFKNYLTQNVHLTVSDAAKVMSSFNSAITELKEQKAKEALPNDPSLNMTKKDIDALKEKAENKEEPNTHGLKSREKRVTGEGEKIEKKGEGINAQKAKDREALKHVFKQVLSDAIKVVRDADKNNDGEEDNPGSAQSHNMDAFANAHEMIEERAYKQLDEYFKKYGIAPDGLMGRAFLNDLQEELREEWNNTNLPKGLSGQLNIASNYYKKHLKLEHFEEDSMDDILEHAENEGGKTVREVFEGMSDEQQSLVFYFLKKARQLIDDGEIKHSDKEEDEMKHNVFDDAKETKENTISHADMEKLEADVFKDAKSKGSLKDAFLAHADDYGIDNIEWLFPEDRNLNNPPAWIKRPDGWVSKVMKGVHHSPFSRIKSVFADITEPDARARGYMKGNRKVEEVFGLLKRSTSPTTVYKKQKLDRDDIVDITDFDVVSWLKTEMRGMLDEELARAFLVSDGRSPASNDKINEQNIRPIWTDDDLFVIRKPIAVTSSTTTDEKCKQFIRSAIKARKDYKGSGNPTLFTTDDLVSDLMLMEDQIGHPLYETMEKLTAKLRVKEIVTVPVMENLTRTSGTMTFELMGIIVNLDDYNVGADKGGAVAMFEDFDIDYNQEKYLIETRCSGALTKPYSAIVIESTSSIYLDVDPDDPTETRYSKAVSTLQSDVVVNDDSIGGTLKYVTGYTGYSEDTDLQSGNYLSLAISAPTGATTTVKMVNNGGINETETTLSNDYYVAYVKSKNAKIIVTTTLSGVSMTKTYSLRLLKLEKA